MEKAIEVEIKRQVECLESGQTIFQETRSFDANNDSSFSIRTKRDADDYRYFPEPDLTPFNFQEEFLNAIKNSLPALPKNYLCATRKSWVYLNMTPGIDR